MPLSIFLWQVRARHLGRGNDSPFWLATKVKLMLEELHR